MKIQLVSDLHLEFLQHDWPGERLIAPVPRADVLVLAGDIANGADPFKLFAHWPSHPKRVPIIYVCGNHELYSHAIDPMIRKMREGAALNNILFLENNSVEIGGVRFLGTTLWTDYRLPGLNRTQRQLMEYVGSRLNDHFSIRTGRHAFTPRDAFARHEIARAWLEAELAKPFAGKTVVVTHHAPHQLSTHPRYIGNQLNAGFISDLSDLMPGVDLWLHGHVHDSFDYQVGRCRVVANPAGYIRNRWDERDNYVFENQAFNKNLLLELET